LQEVVGKEGLKWLDYGIIYYISDSEWATHIQLFLRRLVLP